MNADFSLRIQMSKYFFKSFLVSGLFILLFMVNLIFWNLTQEDLSKAANPAAPFIFLGADYLNPQEGKSVESVKW